MRWSNRLNIRRFPHIVPTPKIFHDGPPIFTQSHEDCLVQPSISLNSPTEFDSSHDRLEYRNLLRLGIKRTANYGDDMASPSSLYDTKDFRETQSLSGGNYLCTNNPRSLAIATLAAPVLVGKRPHKLWQIIGDTRIK